MTRTGKGNGSPPAGRCVFGGCCRERARGDRGTRRSAARRGPRCPAVMAACRFVPRRSATATAACRDTRRRCAGWRPAGQSNALRRTPEASARARSRSFSFDAVQPPGDDREQLWGRLQVPVRIRWIPVTEIRAQQRQLTVDLDTGVMPVKQRGHSKSMSEIVRARAFTMPGSVTGFV